MNWDDCAGIWKRQPLPVGAGASTAELVRTFAAKSRRLAAALWLRDVIEALAGLLLVGVYAVMWWRIGGEGWPLAGAILLMLGLTGFFVRERVRARRCRPSPEAPLRVRLEAELTELQHQRRLLSRVGTWYLLPCALAVGCCLAAVIPRAVRQLPPEFWTRLGEHPLLMVGMVGSFGLILVGVFGGVWMLNRRAVRKDLEPRIEELERLRGEFAAD